MMTERQFSFPRLLVNLSCLLLAAVLLAGCGSRDTSWRKGGVPGSKPYTVRGKTYYPLKSAHGFVEEGVASWYGPGFHGKKTASGERFNQYNISAAHKILPLGTEVRVTNLENHRSLILRINDRGPFVDDRVIDLSRGAAQRLGVIGKGTARVRIQSLGDAFVTASSASSHASRCLFAVSSVIPAIYNIPPLFLLPRFTTFFVVCGLFSFFFGFFNGTPVISIAAVA